MTILYYYCFLFFIAQAIHWLWKIMNKGIKGKCLRDTIITFTVYLVEIVSWVAGCWMFVVK